MPPPPPVPLFPASASRARATSRPRAAAASRAAGDAEPTGAAAGWGQNKCSLARDHDALFPVEDIAGRIYGLKEDIFNCRQKISSIALRNEKKTSNGGG